MQEVNKELEVMKSKCTLAQIMVTGFHDLFGKGCKTRLLAVWSGKAGSGLGISALFSVPHIAEIPFLLLPQEWMNFGQSGQNRHIPSVLSKGGCPL